MPHSSREKHILYKTTLFNGLLINYYLSSAFPDFFILIPSLSYPDFFRVHFDLIFGLDSYFDLSVPYGVQLITPMTDKSLPTRASDDQKSKANPLKPEKRMLIAK